MSSPSGQPQHPLHQIPKVNSNTLAIRVVPYSPPRPDGDQSHLPSPLIAASSYGKSDSSTVNFGARLRNCLETTSSAELGGYQWGSASAPSVDSLVSDPVFPKEELTSTVEAARQSTSTTIPAISRASYTPSVSNVNASPQHTQRKTAEHSTHNDHDFSAPAGLVSSQHQPVSRRRNIIALHADKTFSLVPQRAAGGYRSPRLSLSTTSISSDPFSDDAPSSSDTTLPARSRSISPCVLTPSAAAHASTLTTDEPGLNNPLGTAISPGNYRMVRGLRKISTASNLKPHRQTNATEAESRPQSQDHHSFGIGPEFQLVAGRPVLPRVSTGSALVPKPSFQSSISASTASETTNYKTYGGSSSPCLPDNLSLAPSSDDSNYQLIGPSSPPLTWGDSPRAPPASSDSGDNYVLHSDGDSWLTTSTVVKVKRHVDSQYSHESLTVSPLRPQRRLSSEALSCYAARSRESLRRVGSLSSITSILSQETIRTFVSSPAALYLQVGSLGYPGPGQQDSWPTLPLPSSSSTSCSTTTARRTQTQMLSHPHQWSSQLSTVASESEDDVGGGSRAVSATSRASFSGSRSSGVYSNHSGNFLGNSSCVTGHYNTLPQSGPPSDHMGRPQPSYARSSHQKCSAGRQVWDQDEYGDGLTDLDGLRHKPSWARLSAFFASGMPLDRNLQSSASSPANSLNSSSLPSWARVYYGSGERKLLKPSYESMFSDYSDVSPPQSLWRSGSPSTEYFPPDTYDQRRQPRPVAGGSAQSSSGSMGITHPTTIPAWGWPLGTRVRRQTSSIWSPHLRLDQRATRHSIWQQPPSVSWSAETGVVGRRNIQVVMFVMGFAFPFAWMVAAFLPLPSRPQLDKGEPDAHTSHDGIADFRRPARSHVHAADEAQYMYEGARWWRRLNRYMSLVGLLVITSVVVLTVVGLRQGWGSSA